MKTITDNIAPIFIKSSENWINNYQGAMFEHQNKNMVLSKT